MAARDTRWSEMEHARIDENQLADRYLMGPDNPWFAAPSR